VFLIFTNTCDLYKKYKAKEIREKKKIQKKAKISSLNRVSSKETDNAPHTPTKIQFDSDENDQNENEAVQAHPKRQRLTPQDSIEIAEIHVTL
jgi:hypothetical protein